MGKENKMKYDYECRKCAHVFEVNRGMKQKTKFKCNECGSLDTYQLFTSIPVTYIRGNGYLDKPGRQRDMNLHKLVNDDPYVGMREKGEADDLAHRLRAGGKRNKKAKTTWLGSKKPTKL